DVAHGRAFVDDVGQKLIASVDAAFLGRLRQWKPLINGACLPLSIM
ncbi:MAG: hypothetical protein RL317_1530, partial [Pseudomonadota bacterium]